MISARRGHPYIAAAMLRDPASSAYADSGLATGPHPRLTPTLSLHKSYPQVALFVKI